MIRRHSIPLSNDRPTTRKEFANTAFIGGSSARQDRLHGRSKEIVQAVLAGLVASNYKATCTLDTLSADLCTTPASLRMAMKAPIDLGLLTVRGSTVYPTAQLIQQFQPNISTDEAARIVQQLAPSSAG